MIWVCSESYPATPNFMASIMKNLMVYQHLPIKVAMVATRRLGWSSDPPASHRTLQAPFSVSLSGSPELNCNLMWDFYGFLGFTLAQHWRSETWTYFSMWLWLTARIWPKIAPLHQWLLTRNQSLPGRRCPHHNGGGHIDMAFSTPPKKSKNPMVHHHFSPVKNEFFIFCWHTVHTLW